MTHTIHGPSLGYGHSPEDVFFRTGGQGAEHMLGRVSTQPMEGVFVDGHVPTELDLELDAIEDGVEPVEHIEVEVDDEAEPIRVASHQHPVTDRSRGHRREKEYEYEVNHRTNGRKPRRHF